MLCAPEEAAPVCSDHCVFTKFASDTAIGQFPCDTSIPSDTLRPFIQTVFFYSATITRDIFHCSKRFAVVWEEGPYERQFDTEPYPPPLEIHNLTAPPSAPGHPIESGVFNASNQTKEISLVRNQVLEVDYDMKSAPL